MISEETNLKGYTIEKNGYLGSGRFSHVYKARHDTSGGLVAFKVCKENCSREEVNRFYKENRILRKLHPHDGIICPHCKAFNENSLDCYAMELADGNLEEYLDGKKREIKEKLDLYIEICESMSYAHGKKVVHRDLWWDNILIKKIKEKNRSKIGDFGRAKDFDEIDSIYPAQTVAVMKYIVPPENCFKIWDKAKHEEYIYSDIYSLGIILFYIFDAKPVIYDALKNDSIINAKRGFELDSMSENERKILYKNWIDNFDFSIIDNYLQVRLVDNKISVHLNSIIRKLCHPNFDERYANIDLVIESLKKIKI